VITVGLLESLPDGPGVFAFGSLVRSTLAVGGDGDPSLRAAVQRALANPRLRLRAHCLRVELVPDPASRVRELLAAYANAHDGQLPPEQPRVGAALEVRSPSEPPRTTRVEPLRSRSAPSWSERARNRVPAVA